MAARQEYPKPQFERKNWLNLNGEWQFEFDFGSSNPGNYQKPDVTLSKAINVPFCPESELSGIGYKDFMHTVWYKKKVTLTEEQLSGRVLLYFGAADYHTTVWVNDREVGKHDGGYVTFSFDITKYAMSGENDITVRCDDETRSGRQPRGKQSPHTGSFGCEYTRTTGIWQTVWLEFVPTVYLKRVKVDTDFRTGTILFASETAGGDPAMLTLSATVSYKGEKVAEICVPAATTNQFSVTVPDAKLWDVACPELYDVVYRLGEDEVASYVGIRGVELKNNAIYLNGRPVYQRLVLDQGFYPDGIYTAPDDETLKKDIVLSMEAGFNGARLHEKIFEERFLYHADCLGYLVWGEHANWGLNHADPASVHDFLPEWLEAVERDYNHPAIVGWCPFNETWDVNGRPQDNRVLRTVWLATKAIDKTRPVIDTSGNYHVETDIYDIHEYDQDIDVLHERYDEAKVGEKLFDFHGQGGRRQQYGGQPIFVSEYGGTWWSPGKEGGWGYGKTPEGEKEAVDRICDLTRYFLENPNFCAFCYTQLYDVEQEQNGVYTYERGRKFSDESYARLKAAFSGKAAIEE